jgi:hypothetical protein
VTRFQYNEAGRLVRTDLPDGSSRHQEYHPNGAIKRQWGSQQYPVGYEYDAPSSQMVNKYQFLSIQLVRHSSVGWWMRLMAP